MESLSEESTTNNNVSDLQMSDTSSVQVVLRIRPLVESEISKGCQDVLEVYSELEQIRIKNSDKAFTFNYVLPSTSSQGELYDKCVKGLITNLFKGYNVTILAYGQTGSGKTYSMGTAYNGYGEMGVIPRAISDIFENVKDQFLYEFIITVSFMELYQEVLYDLLSTKPRDQCVLDIREDASKGIVIQGLTEIPVQNASDVLAQLAKGSQGRATGCTNMNAQSSRSHAIFTITITMQNRENLNERKTARFTLVDLAGSERSKKTGAIGTTFKEGVNINKGLLVLGNVISALGDEKQQHGFIPYRDSNLTRLLKDSLGGNSITLMIACVSPADYNVEETLSTLRYADRARKIKNKPVVNQDAKTAEIIELRRTIQQLKLQIIGQGGPVISSTEIDALQKEITELRIKIRDLTFQLSSVLNDNTGLLEKILILQTANETLTEKITQVKEEYDVTLNNISLGIEKNDTEQVKQNLVKLQEIQQQFIAIDSEQKQADTEMRNHETDCTSWLNSSRGKEIPTEVEINEKQATYTNKQMALKSELEEITMKLALKEHLAKQIQSNTQSMVDYSAMAENEEKISNLMKEKDELLQQLKNVHSKDASSKIAEQRRKRVQELEASIQDLKKKIQEQARLIKLKEKDELKIKNLNCEIVQMKHDKVRLIRSMREESERFRTWRQQRERELAKLKQEDRKKQNQIVKMEAMHTKQQNVLKRKVEEAAAINRRLKDALALRKQAQEQRLGGKVVKIGHWLKQEMDIYMSIVEADSTLADLLEDRATLQQQLDEVKSNQDSPDPEQIKALEDGIEMRSVQIQDLQQKILDFNEDNKAKTRWDSIQSMTEAKVALKTLWDMCADIKKTEVSANNKTTELQSGHSELTKRIESLENEIKLINQRHSQEASVLQKEQEEKIAILLKQLRGKAIESADEQLKQRITIQQEKMDEQEHEIQKLEQANAELNEKLTVINETLEKDSKVLNHTVTFKTETEDIENGIDEEESNMKTPPTKRTLTGVLKVKKPKKTGDGLFLVPENKENDNLNSSTEYEENDDPDRDPDWRKTPLGKRILEERKILKQSALFMETLGIKRSSDGACACSKNCTSRCGCRKSSRSCGISCKCKGNCTNTSNLEDCSNKSSDDAVTEEDTSYDFDSKKARSDSALPIRKPQKRTRQLFQVKD